jgi:hypothetical protein
MRKIALVAYCLFVSIYLCLGWWVGIAYLIVGAIIGVALRELHRVSYRQ